MLAFGNGREGINSRFGGGVIHASTITDNNFYGLNTDNLTHNQLLVTNNGSGASDASLSHSFSSNSTISYLGIPSTDSVNASAVSSTSQSFASVQDWFNFESKYRGWIPATNYSSNPTFCATGGTCTVFDYSLTSAATQVVNQSKVLGTQNELFTAGATCPTAVAGTATSTYTAQQWNGIYTAAVSIPYLQNAIEILNTGGNNNGLCESGESCIYLPNYGVYPGEGTLSTQTCNFQNGTVTNVKMYGYSQVASSLSATPRVLVTQTPRPTPTPEAPTPTPGPTATPAPTPGDVSSIIADGHTWIQGHTTSGSCQTVCSAYSLSCDQSRMNTMSTDSSCTIAKKILPGLSCLLCGPSDSSNPYCFSPGYPDDGSQSAYYNLTGSYSCSTVPDTRVVPICPCH